MGSRTLDATLEQRVREVVHTLGATLQAQETIGRAGLSHPPTHAPLPLISIDQGAEGDALAVTGDASSDLQLLGMLGAGGMGAVYAARQRALAREVAVKRPLSATATEASRAALLAEGRVMGALEHPNVVPVHALGRDAQGLPVLVMKRIEGVSWSELLRDPAHPLWERLGAGQGSGLAFHVEVLRAVCNALHFAHSRGVVHRDVKPDNVMVGAFGEVYLLDWGIALQRGQGASAVVGTPAYMAPEMVLDPESADAQTDVYLLGATLHEVLVGRPLHEASTLVEAFRSVLLAAPYEYPESVPEDLAALCAAATHPERSKRLASCAAFRDALAAYAAHRASRDLSASALAKLAQAEGLLRDAPAALEGVELGVLLAEARFGLEQSLREWPENGAARRGLQRCLERAFERELAHRNAAAARVLLAAMPEPVGPFEARLAELERALSASRALEAEAAEKALQMNQSVSAWPRILGFTGFLLVGVGLSVGGYLEERRTGLTMPMSDQLKLDGGVLTFLAVTLTLGRRRLLTNAYNRGLWSLWTLGCLGVFGVDLFFWYRRYDAWSATVVDFGLLSSVFAAGALTFSRSVAWIALTAFVVSLGSALRPSLSTPLATFGLFVAMAIVLEQSRRSAVKKDPAAPGSP